MEENLIEEWKAIPDYNERYFASTLGRIKNSKGKILKHLEIFKLNNYRNI